MKKLLLSLCLLLTSFGSMAYDVEVDGIYYNLSGTEATVTYQGYEKSSTYSIDGIRIYSSDYSGSVKVPETITYDGQTYVVSRIDDSAFSGCTDLVSLTIPSSVIYLGRRVFDGCDALESLIVEEGNTHLDSREGCNAIILTSSNMLMAGCKNTVITSSVTSIAENAFFGCTGLTSVIIPSNVQYIGKGAFACCGALESIVVEEGNVYYDSRNDCNAIIKTKTNALIAGCKNTVIPEGTKEILDDSFLGCGGLTSIVIPEGVEYIGGGAFSMWNGNSGIGPVGTLVIPNTVKSIEREAFAYCAGLTSVSIPNSTTSIGYNAFLQCTGLESVTVDCPVVGSWFSGMTSLKEVFFGENVTSIDDGAFSRCSGLTSVNIPNSVTEIGSWAFRNCSSLASVTIFGTPTIGSGAFDGTPWLNNQSGVVYIGTIAYTYLGEMPENTSITLKAGTTAIADDAFRYCTGLTSVTIPNSVNSIGSSAFYGCTGLTSVTIPNSVNSIGSYAFYGCTGLTSVNIPNSVNSIGNSAFAGCNDLTSVTINSNVIASQSYTDSSNLSNIFGSQVKDYVFGDEVETIGSYVCYGCSDLTSVTIGNSVTSIGTYAFSSCTGLTSIAIPNSVTSIGIYAFYDTPWYDNQPDGLVYAGKVAYKYKGTMPENTEIVLEDGTLGIAASAFSGGSGLTSVTIPNSVTKIGDNAFYGCSGLESIIVEAGNTVYDSREDCNAIIETASNTLVLGCKNTVIPNSVTSIGNGAFYKCSSLTSVNIPNSVTSIGEGAFENCSGLSSVTIPNSVTEIGDCAFYYCTSLTSVTIGNSVTSIGNYAFYRCSGLTSVTIGNSVTSIGGYAFYGCSGLTSVTIPNSVTSIGGGAFFGCSGLTDVYCFAENIPSTTSSSFSITIVRRATTLHVPTASLEEYKTTSPWSAFSTIVALTDEELTGIRSIDNGQWKMDNEAGAVYDLGGRRTDMMKRGINIIRYSDGTTKKIMMK